MGYPTISGTWPACGEVDIMEFYQKSIFANLCWSNATGGSVWRTVKTAFTQFTNRDTEWADKYHVWRMDWDSLTIRLFLDDELLNVTALSRTIQPVGNYCLSAEPFKNPMYLRLNLALRTADGIDETFLPMTYYVDYVRFYQKNEKDMPTGIGAVQTSDAAWLLTNQFGQPHINTSIFDGETCIRVYNMSGSLMHTGTTVSSQAAYPLSDLAKGVYVVKATDISRSWSAKIVIY